MKKIYLSILCGALMLSTSSCSLFEWAALNSDSSNETKGAVIGAASGARTGAFIGSLFGHGYHQSRDNSLLGAAIGVVAGAAVGAAVGNSMDKAKEEKAAVTYNAESGYDGTRYYSSANNSIFYKEKKVSLTKDAKKNLDYVAQKLISDPTAVVEVYGHTDNSQDVNTLRRISVERATEVKGYLLKKGVPSNQIYCQGCADQYPVASNSTEEGRAQNRRVELIITHPGTEDATTNSTPSSTTNSTVDNSTAIK